MKGNGLRRRGAVKFVVLRGSSNELDNRVVTDIVEPIRTAREKPTEEPEDETEDRYESEFELESI